MITNDDWMILLLVFHRRQALSHYWQCGDGEGDRAHCSWCAGPAGRRVEGSVYNSTAGR